jgi:hypothetical protein
MADNPYHVQLNEKGERSLVRNVITAVYPVDKKD